MICSSATGAMASRGMISRAIAISASRTSASGSRPGSWTLRCAREPQHLPASFDTPETGTVEFAASAAAGRCRLCGRRALEQDVATREAFLSTALARGLLADGITAALVVANNVLAHVPDPHDLVEGMCLLLRHGGRILSESHGGSLRVIAGRDPVRSEAVADLLALEARSGILGPEAWSRFAAAVDARLAALDGHLRELDRRGLSLAAYGAAAKGTILLNSLGETARLLAYVVDRAPPKHGRRVPGVHLPVYPVEQLTASPPDALLLLPWNLRREIAGQLAGYFAGGGRLIVPLPELQTLGPGDG